MPGIKSISSTANYTVERAEQTVHKILPPPATKKTIQVANNIFKIKDYLIKGSLQDRQVMEVLSGTESLIGIGATVKNIFFWANAFTKKTLDDAALKESLISTLCDPIQDPKQSAIQRTIATDIYTEVMAKETFYSKEEVREAVKEKLIGHTSKADEAEKIAMMVTVRQKDRPITLLFTAACFTFLDFYSNVLTLKKWNIYDLTQIAFKIGSKSRVFMFVADLGAQTVLGTIASAALIVTFGEASYRMVINAMEVYNKAPGKEKDEAWKLVRTAILDMLSSGTDLLSTVAPLLFTINPPLVVAFALVAKGTGLIIIFIR